MRSPRALAAARTAVQTFARTYLHRTASPAHLPGRISRNAPASNATIIKGINGLLAGFCTIMLCACSSQQSINNRAAQLSHSTAAKSSASTSDFSNTALQFKPTTSTSITNKDPVDLTSEHVAADDTATPKAYRIGPHDVLKVSVFNVPELSKAVAVAESGTINFPLVGETHAVGRTARDLEISLARSLGARYLQNPQVSVLITKHNSQRVTIEGAVRKPGIYPLLGTMSLLQLVASAEGLTEASDDNVVIFRRLDGQRRAARFSIAAIRDGSSEDPGLQAGDVVVANSSAYKKLFNNILKAMPVAGLFALL